MKFFRPFQHLTVAIMTLLGSAAVPLDRVTKAAFEGSCGPNVVLDGD